MDLRRELHVRRGALCLLIAFAALARPAAAAQLEAFASVEAGFAGLCTFASVFLPGMPIAASYGMPSGQTFQQCGFSGDSGADDEIGAAPAASWSASAPGFSGTAQSSADFGVLQASASGTNTNAGNSLGDAAGAFALFTDTLTITSPTQADGQPGFLAFDLFFEGQIDATNGDFDPTQGPPLGGGSAIVAIVVGPQIVDTFLAEVLLNGADLPLTNPHLPGFVATLEPTGRSLGGTEVVATSSQYAPSFTFGTPFTLTVGLLAQADPRTESSALGTASTDFSTVRLVGVRALDVSHQPVTDDVIVSESGTQYVPEPPVGTWAFAALGVLALRVRAASASTSS